MTMRSRVMGWWWLDHRGRLVWCWTLFGGWARARARWAQ